jgi:ATP-dependent 26S proteasome regulatory subunit
VALNSPVYIYHLDTMTDKNLVSEWGGGGNAAQIRLLEDFDTIFTGRKNNFLNDMNNALSFDCLLNVLDGVVVAEGSLTIITTNHLDSIDPALVRPGRVDTKIEFKALDTIGKLHIGRTILPDMSDEELNAFFSETLPNHAVGAVIQETCIKEALRQYWASQDRK